MKSARKHPAHDEFIGEEVSLQEGWSASEGDPEPTVRTPQAQAEAEVRAPHRPSDTQDSPAVVEFLRSFLHQTNMTKTLDCFQTEWLEMTQKGLAGVNQTAKTPAVYVENQRLHRQLRGARREEEALSRAAASAARLLAQAQRDRDQHHLQHHREIQEKNRLTAELGRLQAQCGQYQAEVQRMKDKYQAVAKQLGRLTGERETVRGQDNPQPPQSGGPEGEQSSRPRSSLQ